MSEIENQHVPEEKTIEVSQTKAKQLRAKTPRSEAQIAATAKLVEATKARRELAKEQRRQEEEARVKAHEERLKAEQEAALSKVKIVVKPKRKYTKKPKMVPQEEMGSVSDESEESEEELEDPKPRKVDPRKVVRRVKEAIEDIDKTIQQASSNQYENLLRRKGFM
jgi:hypothetical protein